MNESRFRYGISDRRAGGPEPRDRGDVDDAALTLRLHDRRRRLDEAHRPGEIDVEDLVPDLHRQAVEVGERDRLVIGGIVDEDVEAAEALHDVADDALGRRTVGDVALKRGGVDLVARGEIARDAFGLVAALGIHDRDMRALFRERVTDALTDPAIAAGDERHRTVEIHRSSPYAKDSVIAE